jgi:hypothetical protein
MAAVLSVVSDPLRKAGKQGKFPVIFFLLSLEFE